MFNASASYMKLCIYFKSCTVYQVHQVLTLNRLKFLITFSLSNYQIMSSVVKGEYDEMDGETLEDYIVKAKGFSYDTTATDLAQFFAGCDIKGGKAEGVHFLVSRTG